MKKFSCSICFLLIILLPVICTGQDSSAFIQADIKFINLPSQVSPGATFPVTVKYDTNLPEMNILFVALLRVKTSIDAAEYLEYVLDNEGYGYNSPDGTIIFNISIDPSYKGNIFLEAYLAPFSMNKKILEMVATYPTNGTHDYLWKGGTTGFTRDLNYMDQRFGKGQKNGTTYCCGLTFETFLRTYQEYNQQFGINQISDISFQAMKACKVEWFGSAGDQERQMITVLEKTGLGLKIVDKNQARAGDFCMFWRKSGSGHSVIFIDWVLGPGGEISGIKYWSAQKKTKGIGYREEKIGTARGLDENRIYIGRLKKPRDIKDWEWRYASTITPMPIWAQ
jgi:hypothetical protein